MGRVGDFYFLYFLIILTALKNRMVLTETFNTFKLNCQIELIKNSCFFFVVVFFSKILARKIAPKISAFFKHFFSVISKKKKGGGG